MEYAIETELLCKHFGPVRAVDGVSLRVAPGEIYGFLGLNGAGKTTTIRALLGMVRPTSGSVSILSRRIGCGGRGPWGSVGYLVEKPAAYHELTVLENLELARRLYGFPDPGAASSAIERLGLAPYAGRRAGTLSTGNFQRLALARAMLHQPQLLILDEPANGLDPAGVVEIRGLLSSLSRELGVTVFMSSHILSEVDRLATRIGIIHQGRLLEELNTGQLEQMRRPYLEVAARDLVAARGALESAGFAVQPAGKTLRLAERRALEEPDLVSSTLVQAGYPPTLLIARREDLEEHFLRLTEASP